MKRRLSAILAVVSLLACLACATSWAFDIAEASYRSDGGLVFSLQAEHLRDAFSLTLAWPVGPSVVDDHGRLISPIPPLAAYPPLPTRHQWHRFTLERGQWPIEIIWLRAHLDPPHEPPAYLVNLYARPHRYVQFLWPRAAMGLLAIPFAVFPILWTHAFLRRRTIEHRRSAGLCLNCAYDLRTQLASRPPGTVPHPRHCPECGTEIPAV